MSIRTTRKNSDSGISVSSSSGLNTSESSMDTDITAEIHRDQLTWFPLPTIMLENICLPNTSSTSYLSEQNLNTSSTSNLSEQNVNTSSTSNLSEQNVNTSSTSNLSEQNVNTSSTSNLSEQNVNTSSTLNLSEQNVNTSSTSNLSEQNMSTSSTSNLSEQNVSDSSDEDSFLNFTITTGLIGRTVNGQLLVIQPEEENVEQPSESELTVISSEDEDEDDRTFDTDEKLASAWDRTEVYYDVVEVTSEHKIFNGARMASLCDLDDSVSDVSSEVLFEPFFNSTPEKFITNSAVIFGAPIDVRVKQENIVSPYLSLSNNVKRRRIDTFPKDLAPTQHSGSQKLVWEINNKAEPAEFNISKNNTKIEVLQNTVVEPKMFKIPKMTKIGECSKRKIQLDDDQLSIHISSDVETELDKQLNLLSTPRRRNILSREKHMQRLENEKKNTASGYRTTPWDMNMQQANNDMRDNTVFPENSQTRNFRGNRDEGFSNCDDEIQTHNNATFNNYNAKSQTPIINHLNNSNKETQARSTFKEMDKNTRMYNDFNAKTGDIDKRMQLKNNTPAVIPDDAERTQTRFNITSAVFNSRSRNDNVSPFVSTNDLQKDQYSFYAGNLNLNKNQQNDFYTSNSRSNQNQYNDFYSTNLISNLNQRNHLTSSLSCSNINQRNHLSSSLSCSNINQANDFYSSNFSSNLNQRNALHASSSTSNINYSNGTYSNNLSLNINQPNDFYATNTSLHNSFQNLNKNLSDRHMNENIEQWMCKRWPPVTLSGLTHHLCRKLKSCKLSACRFFHEIPDNFEELLRNAQMLEIDRITNYILNNCYDEFNKDTIPKILTYHSQRNNLSKIIALTTTINSSEVLHPGTKVYLMQRVVKSIMDADEAYDFEKAIREIIMYNGTKSTISDILLKIIVKKKDFLVDCYQLIWDVMRHRNTFSTYIIDLIVKECIRMENHEDETKTVCYRTVSKILDHHGSSKVALKQIETFLGIIENMGLEDCVACVQKLLPKRPSYPCENNKSGHIFLSKFDSVVSDRLRGFILEKNIEELVTVFRENVHQPDFLFQVFALVHEKKAASSSTLVSIFQDLVSSLDYYRTEENLRLAIETVAFNLLPLYDMEKDYENASTIICLFEDNIKSFISVKSFITVAPYKDNLKNEPEKLVLLLKILNRANVLNLAFTLIKMPEFQLLHCTVPSLFKYKAQLIDEFVLNAVERDRKLSWEIIQYLICNSDINLFHNVQMYYRCYLKKYLICDDSGFIEEFKNSINFYYKMLSNDLLRAIIANLSRMLQPSELEPMYDFCCSQSIYLPHIGTENQITLRKNMMKDEIKLVFAMFFHKAVKLNRPAIELKIVLDETMALRSPTIELGKFKAPAPEKCDEKNMLLRLSSALFTFQPSIDITEDPERLPVNVVKQCLEVARRNLPM